MVGCHPRNSGNEDSWVYTVGEDMTIEEQKWIETNNSVCALLRQAHDVLAMSSFSPKRKWVGLTVDEIEVLGEIYAEKDRKIQAWGLFAVAVEEKLKEKNT